MKYMELAPDLRPASRVALGCMRIRNMTPKEVDRYLKCAVELGYNYFDHADIYGRGHCEEVFGAALARNPSLRDQIILQTKCGIKKGMYDHSRKHIVSSVENSLRRLGVEQIDVLLLHRPDLLMEPEEVAAAFDELEQSGKVRHFGVSNHGPLQIEVLKTAVKQKLIVNQLQLSITNATMISSGASVNVDNHDGVNRDGYLRDYCRLHGITVQPWSPLLHGGSKKSFLGNENFAHLNAVLRDLAQQYDTTDTGLAIAWLLRLPEKMQPIVGSTNLDRLKEIAQATEVTISAEDWYRIYRAAGYALP